jgi:hypothetical protein
MAMVGCCLALAQGCAHVERAEYDPCARQSERRNSDSGPRIISCRLFYIPFRAEVVDAETGGPIATAAALNCTNVLGEAADDGPVVAFSADSGLLEGEVDTFTDVANPWNNECFRSTFRGILIEIRKEGYVPFRGYLPLPATEGEVVELGVIRLGAKQE